MTGDVSRSSRRQTVAKGGRTMIVRRLLFETRVGEMFLTLLERRLGLAVIQAKGLAEEHAGQPVTVGEPH